MSTQRPFSVEARQQLLTQFSETLEERALAWANSPRKTNKGAVTLDYELRDLKQAYAAGVPIIPISRCPYCQKTIHLGIDYFDLDGLMWSWAG